MSDCTTTELLSSTLEITLNRPEARNALSKQLLTDLARTLVEQRDNDEIKAVILRGSGGCFSAGADLADIRGTIDDVSVDGAIEAVVKAIEAFPVPVIAAVEGACMGAAVDVALSCDLCLADESAFFEVPATRLNLFYNPYSLVHKTKALSPHTLTRLFVIGERMDAQQALAAGMISHAVDRGDAIARARELAARAALNSREAMSATKAFFGATGKPDFEIERWNEIRLQLLSSPERHEAVNSARRRLGLDREN